MPMRRPSIQSAGVESRGVVGQARHRGARAMSRQKKEPDSPGVSWAKLGIVEVRAMSRQKKESASPGLETRH
ncbi:hypothetical protein BN1723_005761 [Verticillium longisporum]|uniref:Uncharacterized protein n=1 Tax=Verticillium longisporum TaxID=100787 RepID=A0A0G4NBC6_VERLO|nr:hypothetical protein BN1723_005761 [Verticillium longisporum]